MHPLEHLYGLNWLEIYLEGFARLSLPWFAPDDVINYILAAMAFIAKEGWKFMVHYDIDLKTGEWSHVSKTSKASINLSKISYDKGFFEYRMRKEQISGQFEPSLVSKLTELDLIL